MKIAIQNPIKTVSVVLNYFFKNSRKKSSFNKCCYFVNQKLKLQNFISLKINLLYVSKGNVFDKPLLSTQII